MFADWQGHEIRPGDFFVCPAGAKLSPLIRIGQWLLGDGWSPVSHAGIYVGDGEVVESIPGGVSRWSAYEYLGRDTLWSHWDLLSDMERFEIVEEALGQLGNGYRHSNMLGLVLRRLGLPSRWFTKVDAPLCSQFVAGCYWAGAGIQLAKDGQSDMDVTPGRLHRLIQDGCTEDEEMVTAR